MISLSPQKLYSLIIKSPQLFFAITALFFGGIFIVVMPPLQTPDEATHFLRAYQISEGKFISQKVNGVTGDYLPSSIQETINILEKDGPIQFNGNKKYNHRQTKAAFFDIPLKSGEQQFYDISSAASYSPVAYIPQSIGILAGKLFNTPVIVMMYLVRLANLIFWVGAIYVAIGLFPWKKWAAVGIALLPMVVAQSASAGIDALSVGLGAIFLAFILNLYSGKERVNQKIGVTLVLIATLMLLTKQIMIVLLPLLFLLRKEQFDKIRQYWLLMAVGMFVPLLVFALWSLMTPEISQNAAQIQNGQDTEGQIKYMLTEPWRFLLALFFTFFLTWGDGISQSLMGNFGWVDTPLSAVFMNLGYVGLAAYLITNYESYSVSNSLNRFSRWLLFVLTLGYCLLVCVAMYVLYSPLKYDIIIGIQGRYFFPALFLLVPLLLTNTIRIKKEFFIRTVAVISLIMLTVSVLTIIHRYYASYM